MRKLAVSDTQTSNLNGELQQVRTQLQGKGLTFLVTRTKFESNFNHLATTGNEIMLFVYRFVLDMASSHG